MLKVDQLPTATPQGYHFLVLQRDVTPVVLGLMVACEPVPEVNTGYTPSEYHSLSSATSEYDREVSAKGVYEGLYENPAAYKHYCGTGEGVDDLPTWIAACDRTMAKVYWGRVRTQYKYVDWQEVQDYCDLQPQKCATPKGRDDAIRSSHLSGAQRRNYAQAQQVEEQRAERIEAERAVREKFIKSLTCATLELSDEAAAAECRGQRVVRCKAQMSVFATANHSGSQTSVSGRGTAEEVCIESGGQTESGQATSPSGSN